MKKCCVLLCFDVTLLVVLYIFMYMTNNVESVYFNIGWFMLFYIAFQICFAIFLILAIVMIVLKYRNKHK